MTMLPSDPARGALDAQQNRDVNKLLGNLPRFLAHGLRDVLKAAWLAGFDYAKGTKGP